MSKSHEARTTSEAAELAKSMGLVPFFSNEYELMLDYDMPYTEALMRHGSNVHAGKTSKTLRKLFPILYLSCLWTESNHGNAHLYICVNIPLDPITRSMYQALLGSDSTRELYNFVRIQQNRGKEDGYQMALFEKPEAAKAVKAWRQKCELERRIYRLKEARGISGHNLQIAMRNTRKKLGI